MGQQTSLVVMASGTGKTVVLGNDLKEFLESRPDARFLCLCDQKHVLVQNQKTIEAIMGGDASQYGFYHGFRKEGDARFLFASFQTMADHREKFPRDAFAYIAIDESHHTPAATYRPTAEYFTPQFLLALTATPDREDMQDIREIFGEEIYSLPLPKALALGYLTPIDYRLITDPVIELGRIKNPCKLSLKELNKRIFVPRRDDEIVRIIHAKCQGIEHPRIIVFCNSIRHANRFAEHLPGSLAVHSGMSLREQHDRIAKFESGEAAALVTVNKFNEGVDLPEANVIVFLRSTESKTIFYQQLGRGLRKVEGKTKVLVLDFVGTYERLCMIKELQKQVEEEARHPYEYPEPNIVNFGTFLFNEQVLDVLNLLETIEKGFTPEDLVAQLKAEAERLGRTPRAEDIARSSREGRTASMTAFTRYFGSWNKALEAAELELNRFLGYTPEILIAQLKAEAERLGRTPNNKDIARASKEGRTASGTVFGECFGSWNKALAAAELEVLAIGKYNSEILIAQLKAEAERLGRTPTVNDIGAPGGKLTASWSAVTRCFGSWNKGLEAAGLEINSNVGSYTPEILIAQLKAEAERLGRTPTKWDIVHSSKEGRTASDKTFIDCFGSFPETLEAAGYEVKFKPRFLEITPEILIAQLKAEAERLGRTPTCRDIARSAKEGRTASSTTFTDRFGTWNKALEAAGLQCNMLQPSRKN